MTAPRFELRLSFMGIVSVVYRNWIWEFGDLKSDSRILFYGVLAKYDKLKFNIFMLPSSPSYLGPKYDGVEDNSICCFRFDVKACAFETTR